MVSRRRLLLASLFAGLSAFLPRGAVARPRAERLLAVFGRRDSAREVGVRVVASLPAGTGRAALARELAHRHPALPAALDAGDDAEVARLLRETIADDLHHGRVRVVDGWVLARTEAELCALACLS
jgi:hypothetical protein